MSRLPQKLMTTHFLFSTSAANLPKVSYIKFIDIWFLVCTCFIFFSLMEFALVNIISRRKCVIIKHLNINDCQISLKQQLHVGQTPNKNSLIAQGGGADDKDLCRTDLGRGTEVIKNIFNPDSDPGKLDALRSPLRRSAEGTPRTT